MLVDNDWTSVAAISAASLPWGRKSGVRSDSTTVRGESKLDQIAGRRARFRLWREHLPYWVRRRLRPFARVGLWSWPGRLLWTAGLLVLVGLVWAGALLPEPGWPPVWGSSSAAERIQIAGALLSGIAVVGIVVSIAAGVAELDKVFPRQQIHFAVNCTQDERGALSVLAVVNGNAFVEFPRVEVRAELIRQDGTRERLRIADKGPYRDIGQRRLLLEGIVLHPNQMVTGGAFAVPDLDPAWTVEVVIVWSSERSTPSVVRLSHIADTRMGDYR